VNLAMGVSGTDASDRSMLTVDRIFGPEREFKSEDWGPAHWLEDSSGYITLEVAEGFKESEPAEGRGEHQGDREVWGRIRAARGVG